MTDRRPAPQFRKMTAADLPRAARLVKEYYAFDGMPYNAAHTRAALRLVLRQSARAPAAPGLPPAVGGVWLIQVAGKLAGYVALTPCFSLEFHGEVFIDELYLRPAFRRQGVGQATLAFTADWARRNGVTAIHVISEQENPASRRAYRKAGFGGAPRFLMTRLVDPPPHLR